MITRAIITSTDLSNGKVEVRIPIFEDRQNSSFSISTASILCIPGINIDYRVGDIVVIGFEDNDPGSPIVLGYLKLANRNIEPNLYITAKEVVVEDKFNSPTDTTIGISSYQDIFDSVDSLGVMGPTGAIGPTGPTGPTGAAGQSVLTVEENEDGTVNIIMT